MLLSMLASFLSCRKTSSPYLSLNSPRSFSFTDAGGSQNFSFSANRNWRVSSSDSWCRVSPSSGSADDGQITATIICDPNTSYDSRSATVTINVEDLTEAITVTQDSNYGILVSPTVFNLTNAEQTIEVEVRANAQYTVAIDNECSAWIKQSNTKALTTDKITFSIAANASFDDREGKIIIEALKENLSETIIVKQSTNYGILVPQNEYVLTNESQSFEVVINANVDYSIEIDESSKSWLSHAETKSLVSKTSVFYVSSNTKYEPREGVITIKQNNGSIEEKIYVHQAPTECLFVSNDMIDFDSSGGSFCLTVCTNIEYEIIIEPSSETEWISVSEHSNSKTYREETISIIAQQNDGETRHAKMYVLGVSSDEFSNEINVSQTGVNTFIGDIIISTQEELEKWGNSQYEYIRGDVTIKAMSDIHSLALLNNKWKDISGELYINGEYLTSFEGLESLKSTGCITIDKFAGKDFSGLGALKEVNGFFYVLGPCSQLHNFIGLNQIELIEGEFKISGAPSDFNEFSSFEGLESLKSIGSNFYLNSDFRNLLSFEGLGTLQSIGGNFWLQYPSGTSFYSYDSLKSFEGLKSLKRINGEFHLAGSFDNLESFEGLENLEYIGVSLRLGSGYDGDYSSYNSISSFKGLSSLRYLGELIIESNNPNPDTIRSFKKFSSLSGLDNVTNLGGLVVAVPGFSSFDSLSSITNSEMKRISLWNSDVKDLAFLSCVTQVKDYLTLGSCNYLKSIDGLKNFTKAAEITIQTCERLTDIGAFCNLVSVQRLFIRGNTSLYDFSPLQQPFINNAVKYSVISGNGYNPSKEQIINGEGKP